MQWVQFFKCLEPYSRLGGDVKLINVGNSSVLLSFLQRMKNRDEKSKSVCKNTSAELPEENNKFVQF